MLVPRHPQVSFGSCDVAEASCVCVDKRSIVTDDAVFFLSVFLLLLIPLSHRILHSLLILRVKKRDRLETSTQHGEWSPFTV